MNIPDLQQTLRDLLVDDMPGAIAFLQQQLPQNAAKQMELTELLARLNTANKQFRNNLISLDEYQRDLSGINFAFQEIFMELTAADFEAPKVLRDTGKGAKTGSVLYRVPELMTTRRMTRCVVRVAMDEDTVVENLVLDTHVKIENQVEVSDAMEAQLIDPSNGENFNITSPNNTRQLVREIGYTEWVFYVTPLIEGEHQLIVKVSMLELTKNFGLVPRDITLERTIRIVSTAPPPTTLAAPAPLIPATAFVLPGVSPVSGSEEPSIKSGSSVSTVTNSRGGITVARPAPGAAPSEHPKTAQGAISKAPEKVSSVILIVDTGGTTDDSVSTLPSESLVSNRSMKGAALAMLLLVLVGGPVAWAVVPAPVRDWYACRFKDDVTSYETYLEKYPESPFREHALYRKALVTQKVMDWRKYEKQFPKGQYIQKAKQYLETKEQQHWQQLKTKVDTATIGSFLRDFPQSRYLPELIKTVEQSPDLAARMEHRIIENFRQDTTPAVARQLLQAFSKSNHLQQIKQIIAEKPTLQERLQPELEAATVEAIKNDPSVEKIRTFFEEFPTSKRVEEIKQIIDQRPEVARQMQVELRAAERRSTIMISTEEQKAWRAALRQNTIAGYQEFIKKYENSVYVRVAKKRIKANK